MEILASKMALQSLRETTRSQRSFTEVFERVVQEFSAPLNVLKPTVRLKDEFQDLLQAQILMHSYALKVEMLSKAGESLSGTVRRLQQG